MSDFQKEIRFAIISKQENTREILETTILSMPKIDGSSLKVSLNLREGEELIENLQQATYPIDIVILEMVSADQNEFQLIRKVIEKFPLISFIIYFNSNDRLKISLIVLEGGVKACIIKTQDLAELREAIKEVAIHGHYYTSSVTFSLIDTLQEIRSTYVSPESNLRIDHKLSDKEKRVLKEFASELTYKEIAQKLKLSPKTIDGYREHIFYKLGVKSRVGAVLFAIKRRLINII